MKCPACRRIITTEEDCPRCGIPLGPLQEILRLYNQLLARGKTYLKNQMFDEALAAFTASRKLLRSEEARKGIIVSLVSLRKYRIAMDELFSDRVSNPINSDRISL